MPVEPHVAPCDEIQMCFGDSDTDFVSGGANFYAMESDFLVDSGCSWPSYPLDPLIRLNDGIGIKPVAEVVSEESFAESCEY